MDITLDDALEVLEEGGIEVTLVSPGLYILEDITTVTFSALQICAIASALQLTM